MSRVRSIPNPVSLSVLFTLSTIAFGSLASAAEGDPVAIRFWPHDVVTVETHGGLTLGICIGDPPVGKGEAEADGEPDPGEPDPGEPDLGEPDLGGVDHWVVSDSEPNHILGRLPNHPDATFEPIEPSSPKQGHSISITSRSKGDSKLILIEVDGLRIAAGSAASIANVETDEGIGTLDSLVVIGELAGQATLLQQVAKRLAPRYLLVARGEDAAVLDPSIQERSHNTFGVAAVTEGDRSMKVVAMGTTPWQPPEGLAKLFQAMSDSNQKSQAVFAKLSVGQMNFQPSNGTHTPRWNTEHMMGRQLNFFSQIYHTIDPTIPVMDLNPAQMPPDYSASHPDWDGAEEARQMQRVDDFCHRFSYLLDGLDVRAKAPGSRWPSLRALLVQMDRHYAEHTANTVKKFDLEDWPKQ